MSVSAQDAPPPKHLLRGRLQVVGWMLAVGLLVTAAEPEVDSSIQQRSVADSEPAGEVDFWPAVAEANRERALSCRLESTAIDDSADDLIRVWAGLAEARCGRHRDATRLLARAAPGLGDLDHWRFIVQAESALVTGANPDLEESLTARPRWVRDQLEVPLARYLAQKDPERFWRLYQPRLSEPAEPAPTELDEIAWSLADADDDSRRRSVAVRLLVHSPVQASVLQVVDELRDHDGSIDWHGLLGTPLLLTRADNLIDAAIPQGSLTALDEVPTADRGDRWYLLRARALTVDGRGAEAWVTLSAVNDDDPRLDLELSWALAEAALDAAQVRRGRNNLDSSSRASMRARGHQHLDRIFTRSTDPEERAEALRRRVADLNNDDSVEEVTALAAALVELDPNDRSAEQWMWANGWKQYQTGNWTGAIGWWRRLLDIYPRGSEAERARYWSGRAYAMLSNQDRAEALWREVADSPIDHYYARRARERLSVPVPSGGQRFAADPPPQEPRLRLATWMVDSGLPELGRRELARRAVERTTTADHVLAARIETGLGETRQSIVSIWRAYKVLGTPQEVDAPRFAHELYYPRAFEEEVLRHAALTRLEPSLVWAIIRQESAFDPQAKSRSGARGLMQLMPPTGREQAGKLGLRYSLASLTEPDYNLRLGTTYFRRVLDMFDDNLELALAGYNSGPFRMRRMVTARGANLELDEFIESLPWSETPTYVRRIIQFKDSFAQLYPDAVRPG